MVDLWRGVPRSTGELRASLQMLGMYRQIGWQRSAIENRPVDVNGEATPWFSYPALHWLTSIMTGEEQVFEYGSGNSTVWFSQRAASVVSVEHDLGWVEAQQGRLGANVTLLHRTCGGDEDDASNPDPYVDALGSYPVGNFDVIVVDGMARNSCAVAAVEHLPGPGVVILDNADRPAYRCGLLALHAAGFGRIDFVGPNVIQGVFSSTSVFARDIPSGVRAKQDYPTFWGY